MDNFDEEMTGQQEPGLGETIAQGIDDYTKKKGMEEAQREYEDNHRYLEDTPQINESDKEKLNNATSGSEINSQSNDASQIGSTKTGGEGLDNYGSKDKNPRGLNGIQDDKIGKKDQADIDAINNRGKNDDGMYGNKKKKNGEKDDDYGTGDDDDKKKKGKSSSDELDDSKSDKDVKSEDKKDKDKDSKTSKAEEVAKKKEEAEKAKEIKDAANKKTLVLKVKIIFWACVVLLAIMTLIFFISFFIFAFDNITSSITSFFGVKEDSGTDDPAGGLYSDNKYKYVQPTCNLDAYDEDTCKCDPRTEECKELGWEELVKVLNSDDKCNFRNAGLWQEFVDGWDDFFDNKFKDQCQLIRYIRTAIELYEDGFDVTIDPGLVLSTIFYGYAEQAGYLAYDNTENVEIVQDAEHYKVLEAILDKKILSRDDVDRIIQSTIFEQAYPYFTWVAVEDEDTGEITYKCKQSNVENYILSTDKWEMFLRWNDEEDTGNDFSVPGYMKIGNKKLLDKNKALKQDEYGLDKDFLKLIGSGYVYETNMNSAWNSTNEQCNGSIPISELESTYTDGEIDKASVEKAHNFFKNRGMTGTFDVNGYNKKANLDTQTKDDLGSKVIHYATGNVTAKTKTYAFDYRDGFVYIHFPAFKKAIEDNNLPNVHYDEIQTPKKIETVIQEAKDKKSQMDNVLLYDDGTYSSYYTQGGMSAIRAMGVNCGQYLSAPFENLNVHVTDCDGKALLTTDIKDYIISSVYGEIGYQSNNDNYVLTQMVANLSYMLARGSNYSKGENVTIRSGNCDQLYCSQTQGCHSQLSNISCGNSVGKCTSYLPGPYSSGSYWAGHGPMTVEQKQKYSELADIALDHLIIDNSTNKVKLASYVASVSKKWDSQAKSGMNYIDILSQHYDNVTVVQCSGGAKEVNDTAVCANHVTSYNSTFNNKVIEVAEKYNSAGKEVGDCSTFVTTVLKDVYNELQLGKAVTYHTSTDFLRYETTNSCVDANNLKPGDLVFYRTNEDRWQDIGHIAIFAGYDPEGNQLIYESNTGASCKKAKGSECSRTESSDKKYYNIPGLVVDRNVDLIAAYTRWYY